MKNEAVSIKTGKCMNITKPVRSIASRAGCIFSRYLIALSVIVSIIAAFINGILPQVNNHYLKKQVQIFDSDGRFHAERAFQKLKELCEIGPKVVGSYENEVLAVQYLMDEVTDILHQAKQHSYPVSFDVQTASGCFSINLKGFGKVSCYENVQNILVMFESAEKDASETILLNCHFDSVPTSPGASDDGLNCAVMLEIMRIVANSTDFRKKNILFLFNGAEEDGLLASHGFVTSHKWANNISCFINLEACGAGGKEVLFQTGPKAYFLPKIYSKSVPHPFGCVIGEELFQSGLLPSDTDFRIFRDFGHLKGLDFAHFQNGYVYHTSSDNISHVSADVIHHTGNNILSLLLALVKEENLNAKVSGSDDQAIFFDVFGLFMICYSTRMGIFISSVTLLFSLFSIIISVFEILKRKKWKTILVHIGIDYSLIILQTVIVSAVLYGMAALLKWRNLIMLWYSNPWFVMSYYGVATLYVMATVTKLRQSFPSILNGENEAILFFAIVQTMHTTVLFVCLIFGIRSSYVLVIILIPVSLSNLLMTKTKLRKEPARRKILVHVTCNFVSVMYVMYLIFQFFILIIPMTGRIGVAVDSEMIIWSLCQFALVSTFSYLVPLVLVVKNWWKIHAIVGFGYIIHVILILSNWYRPSFTPDAPERFLIMHVHRKLVNIQSGAITDNSGYFITPMDTRSPRTIEMLLTDVNVTQVDDYLCGDAIYCGLPFPYAYLLKSIKKMYWVDAEMPLFPREKQLTVEKNQTNFITRYNLRFIGPGLIDVIILPLNGAEIMNWNLSHVKPVSETTWLNQKLFFIRRSRGLEIHPQWSFWLEFNVSTVSSSSPVFKLAWILYHRSNVTTHYTSQFQKFLNRFPLWTTIVSYVAEFEEYVFQ